MVEVRPLVPSDWPAVAAILADGIATGERIGQLNGAWRDVVLLELRL